MNGSVTSLRWVMTLALAASAVGCGSRAPVDAQRQALDACAPATAPWTAGTAYSSGDRVLAGGQSWQCLAAHTAQAGWEPGRVPSLWAMPTPCGLAAWTQPTLYVVGSRVTFGGRTYQC